MRQLTALILVPLLALGLVASLQAEPKTRQFSDRWIVELVEPPTLEFRGTDLALERSGDRPPMPMFEATAPAVTGEARFDPEAPHVLAYEAFLKERQADFLTDLAALLGRKIVPGGSFRHVANGLVLDISPQEAERLRELPGVARVERERLFRLELSDGPDLIGARSLNEGVPGLPAVKGEGIVVGVIDSGINWDHRAFSANLADTGGYVFQNPKGSQLGLCSRSDVPCNNKLIGVYDFTTASTNGLDIDGHGTHVAAIAAANEWQSGQAGVAPRANLVSYRVCVEKDPDDPDAGTCQSGAILSALDQAVRDRVDVVNFSIGGGPLDPWSSQSAIRVLNLRDAGITFVTSAGNSGPDAGTVGWPAEAPWIFAVGMSTHRERTGRRITMAGAGPWFILYGTGPDLPAQPPTDVPLVAGDTVGGTLEGCNAFPANAFSGRVALLRRGNCLFSDKINNAANAGAVAVVMMNNVGGDPIIMGGLEATTIPAGMVTQAAGNELLGLLDAAGGERLISMPRANVTLRDNSLADQVAPLSSRGPSENAPGLMKPNVVAPGVSIRAAYEPGSTTVAVLSGTSMASPHVAGAIALLRQLNPGLTPAMATSVLETTAETATVTANGDPANIFDRGAGRIRVDLAARAGLYLGVSRAEFVAASPALGGDPGALNLPGLVDENCGSSCTFTRTVTALRPGSWTVSGEGDVEVSVSPSSFSLPAGGSQTLTITVTPANTGNTDLQHGAVLLAPDLFGPPADPAPVEQRLPIGVRSTTGVVGLPEFVRVSAAANQGRRSLNLGFVDNLPEAVFPTSAFERPTVENFSLPQDPNANNPYDRSAGTRTFLVEVPEGTLALWAETTASSAPDIDLFVGRDDNGDGIAQSGEEVCRSITPDELERCVIANPEPGTWWVVVQNWQASGSGSDSVRLELAVLSEERDASLIAFGPGRHAAGPLSLDLYWDVPDLKRDERQVGVVGVGSRAGGAPDIGVVALALERTSALQPRTTLVFPGETLAVAVPANGSHDRLVFDVPPTAAAVSVSVQGEPDVSGSLRRVPFDAVRETAPLTPPPAGPALATGSGSAAGFTLTRTGSVEPGRYFVELQNASSSERVVEVSVTVEESGATVPRFGLWSPVGTATNPRDDIAQGIEWQQAGAGFALWYSYEPDGLPVFYLGTTAMNPASSVWVTEVNRYTIGDGAQIPDLAGTIGITAISEEEMLFSWRLAGGHGSDVKLNFDAPTCPVVDGEPVSYTGTWFTPGEDQGGSSVVITDNAQGHIRYYYDGSGVGRWVLATDGGGAPLAEELDLLEFRGFCPNCTPGPVNFEVVGSYFRSYDNANQGVEALEFTSRPPLNENVLIEVPIQKLSAPLTCP